MEPPATEATAAWAAHRDTGNVPTDVTMDKYIAVDVDVFSREELTDEVHHDDALLDDESDAKDASAARSALSVMDAFDVICNFSGAHDDNVAMQLLTECEHRTTALMSKGRRQTKLTDFFRK
ncbi:hypothetical protein HPB52_016756 [Rhipicephalus sanguineus]|uniref:Uncharacterized protein n=1 Tax=Rhipicephalus sanguineus TaxID=34632 RepID=A0A9D4PHC4_RHISA|nr:hypothetical protein HPB52_016756 [Rhipicephalus sanguineus]